MTETKPFSEWLDELVAAAAEDRRAVSIAGLSDGIALIRVRCDRHKVSLNWTSAYDHLERTEKSHRLHHGPDARLHEIGDVRPLRTDEPGGPAPVSPWTTTRCRRPRCSKWIVWTTLASGARMPVDAHPVTDGPFVLSAVTGGADDAPLAVPLHDDAPVGDVDRYVPHQRTCGAGKGHRRPSGGRR